MISCLTFPQIVEKFNLPSYYECIYLHDICPEIYKDTEGVWKISLAYPFLLKDNVKIYSHCIIQPVNIFYSCKHYLESKSTGLNHFLKSLQIDYITLRKDISFDDITEHFQNLTDLVLQMQTVLTQRNILSYIKDIEWNEKDPKIQEFFKLIQINLMTY